MGLNRYALAWAGVLLLAAPGRAETWPSLELYVQWCSLIVKCKTEVGVGYRVTETWKGVYDPDLFTHRPPAGYINTNNWHGNDEVEDGREIVFFFTPKDYDAKLDAHSTAFHVKNGRVVYASTSWGMQREYTVEEFRRAIRSIVRRQAMAVRTGVPAVAGGVAASGGLPAVPDEEPPVITPAVAVAPASPESGPLVGDEESPEPVGRFAVLIGGLIASFLLVPILRRHCRRG
jgi:hypothetical protein